MQCMGFCEFVLYYISIESLTILTWWRSSDVVAIPAQTAQDMEKL